MDLSFYRNEYKNKPLRKSDVAKNPLIQLQQWLNEAEKARCKEHTAMTLATVNAMGQPSARIVLLKYIENEKLHFFTNYNSRKGGDLISNNKAALLFFWNELERQVRIEGCIYKSDHLLSDQYFNQRPLKSRISAIISPQSKEIESRDHLESLWQEQNAKKEIKRPQDWGGYYLVPERYEFWQGRESRLHDRIIYEQLPEKEFIIKRIAP